jgi:two-component system cell cycle response regulator CtrA
MRVLLIEDEATVAQSIELMLKSENFNTYTTDLGEEGVDLGKLYESWVCAASGRLGP